MSAPVRDRLDYVETVFQVALLTVRRLVRGRRILLALLLLLLPALIGWVVGDSRGPRQQEQFLYEALVFYQFGIAVPATALLLATAFPWPESDEGTLTYWFTSPVRRSAVLLGRSVATLLVGTVLLPLAVGALALPLSGAEIELLGPLRTATTATLLSFPAYASLFCLLATLTRRGLVAGLSIILVENSLALLRGALAHATVVFYVRSLLWPAASRLGRDVLDSKAQIADPSSTAVCIAVFVGVTVVATALSLVAVEWIEYRGKHAQPS